MTERADKELNRAFYDSEREDDRARFDVQPSKVFHNELLVPWIADNLPKGAVVLDVAGGSGVYASGIVRRAPVSVVGLDISESMIRQRAEDPKLALNVVGDMERLPFASESFDAVMFVGCLHHVPDPIGSLREAHRVLRPGGTLFAAEPVSLRASRTVAEPLPDHPHEFRFSRPFLLGRVRAAGFELDRVDGKRFTVRVLSLAVRNPQVGLFRLGDRVDRILGLAGLDRLGEIALVRAHRPGFSLPRERDPETADLLACPTCRTPLAPSDTGLACTTCATAFAAEDDGRILLPRPSALD